jgi:hypothetical protein
VAGKKTGAAFDANNAKSAKICFYKIHIFIPANLISFYSFVLFAFLASKTSVSSVANYYFKSFSSLDEAQRNPGPAPCYPFRMNGFSRE